MLCVEKWSVKGYCINMSNLKLLKKWQLIFISLLKRKLSLYVDNQANRGNSNLSNNLLQSLGCLMKNPLPQSMKLKITLVTFNGWLKISYFCSSSFINKVEQNIVYHYFCRGTNIYLFTLINTKYIVSTYINKII